MLRKSHVLIVAVILTLGACNKASAPASGPAATVTLKDGSTFAGSVTKSDSTAITLVSPTGESRTYPVAQVAGVSYGEPAAVVPPSAPPAAQPASESKMSSAPATSAPKAPVAPKAPAPPPEVLLTIPSGAALKVRNNEAINSQTAASGQSYSGVIAADVLDADGKVAIPKGADATLVVREARGQGKLQGRSELVIDVDSVTVGGRKYQLETQEVMQKGKDGVGMNKRTAIFTGGGSAIGGIIGGVAGGAKGAAIGALSGAAAGTATQTLTRGKAIRVPAETVLTFSLEAPVQVHQIH